MRVQPSSLVRPPRWRAILVGLALAAVALSFHALIAHGSVPLLSSFDVSILGLTATPDPLEPTVPKNTESAVRIVIHSGDRTLSYAEAVSYLGTAFDVKAELSGPGLDHAITVPDLLPGDPPPEDPLLLRFPPLPVSGDYQLANIRIVDPTTHKPLLDVTPSTIPLKVIDQVLVTSVRTRPLTNDEIREKGI